MATAGFEIDGLEANLEALGNNPYPGRGIVIGVSEDSQYTLAYWVMGRSENSRNRLLVQEGRSVRTEAFDESKVEDPSLIIYNAMRTVVLPGLEAHIVSNGDQTDDVANRMQSSAHFDGVRPSFINSLLTREFEPDDPNFTPRITGMFAIRLARTYDYSIIRRNPNTGNPEHTFGSGDFDEIPNGVGLAFHTYDGNGNPLPAFTGSPYPVPLQASAQDTAESLWEVLDKENRVGVAVKTISSHDGSVNYHIINQLGN